MTLYWYVSTFPVREGQAPAISAGFYPKLLALFLGVLAAIQIVTAIVAELRVARASAEAAPGTDPRETPDTAADAGTASETGPSAGAVLPTGTEPALPVDAVDAPPSGRMPAIWKDRKSFGLFLFTVVALVIYPFVLRILGFTITGFLFLGSLIFALSAERRRGKDLILIAIVTVGVGVLTYFVFRRFLQIPFPTGVFGR